MNIWGHVSFILPVFAAIYLFGLRVKWRKYYYLRYLICLAVTTLIIMLSMDNVVNIAINAGLSDFAVLSIRVAFAFLVFLFGFITTLISYDCDIFIAFYLATSGYCMQHLCRVLTNIVILIFPDCGLALEIPCVCVFWILIYGGIYFFYIRPRKKKPVIVDNKIQIIVTTIPILFAIILNSFGGPLIESMGGQIIFDVFIAIIAALAIMIEQMMTRGKEAEIEKATMEKMLRESKEQFLFEKHLIDLINIKAHDLKHQVNEAGKIDGKTKEEVNQLIDDYDSSFNSGSQALDIVLTRKSRECKRHSILLTCMAEGKTLDEFEESEIYSLFGNILDNAIEASRKIQNKEQRVITLFIKKIDDFVIIHESNYYQDAIVMKEGLPDTTKGNNDYHGFGIKSIKSFCDAHDGTMKITTSNNIFSLDIMLIKTKTAL